MENSYNQIRLPYKDKYEIHFEKFTLTELKRQFSNGLRIPVKH